MEGFRTQIFQSRLIEECSLKHIEKAIMFEGVTSIEGHCKMM